MYNRRDLLTNPLVESAWIFFTYCVILVVLSWLFYTVAIDILIRWPEANFPYNFILAFYYYTLAVPIISLVDVWQWLSFNAYGFTQYNNLNRVLLVLAMATILIGFLSVLVLITKGLRKIGINKSKLIIVFLLPAFIGCILQLVRWLLS